MVEKIRNYSYIKHVYLSVYDVGPRKIALVGMWTDYVAFRHVSTNIAYISMHRTLQIALTENNYSTHLSDSTTRKNVYFSTPFSMVY